eukprot:6050884-Amphidinium_carterae.1
MSLGDNVREGPVGGLIYTVSYEPIMISKVTTRLVNGGLPVTLNLLPASVLLSHDSICLGKDVLWQYIIFKLICFETWSCIPSRSSFKSTT